MRKLTLGLLALVALVSGCATTSYQEPQIARISAEELAQLMPPPVATLSLEEIVTLSKQGVSPDDIIAKIKETNSQYALSPSQMVALTTQGVDAKVLDYIHESREQFVRDSMAEEINKRELENQKEQQRLKREYQLRSNAYYHPYFGYSYSPWWGYGPRYGYRFYGHGYRGHRFGYGFGW
ncbi:MAG: hypothetical protein U1E13_07370 [Methylophilaceae bacterium]|nr:hypothetical protein [Methylophilaceae bacterium]